MVQARANRVWMVATCILAAAVRLEGAEGDSMTGVLNGLRTGHPRLFLTPATSDELRERVKSDPALAAVFSNGVKRADAFLNEAAVERRLIGPRLLEQSRTCFRRVSVLGLTYRLTGDRRYSDRAIREMLAAASFSDWNPPHFLDTAEMTAALGVGYDWLYEVMSPDQRKTIREAIVTHGLREGLKCYRGEVKHGWWTRATHNWAQVCNGGLAVGALAIADEEPALAAEVLTSGLQAVQGAMRHFDADGGWDEGPGYWGYTLQYTSYYLDALRTALGTMHDLDRAPGLDRTGFFRIHFTGPVGQTFNFADAHAGRNPAPAMFWLARTFDRPEFAWHHRQEPLDNPFDLIWFDGRGGARAPETLPLDACFRGTDAAFLRSAWDNPDALWVGIKGGNNAANHSHLDLGTFVLDAQGRRWACDLGRDNYDLPGYFGTNRWDYYRLRTEGHNTLLIDEKNQPPKAKAPVVSFATGPAGGSVVFDLSSAYPMTKRVWRGTAMLDRDRVICQDEIENGALRKVAWNMHTGAKVTISEFPARAILDMQGKQMQAEILEPVGAMWTVAPAHAPAPQTANEGISRMSIQVMVPAGSTRIVVVFTPGTERHPAPQVRPLAEWPKDR